MDGYFWVRGRVFYRTWIKQLFLLATPLLFASNPVFFRLVLEKNLFLKMPMHERRKKVTELFCIISSRYQRFCWGLGLLWRRLYSKEKKLISTWVDHRNSFVLRSQVTLYVHPKFLFLFILQLFPSPDKKYQKYQKFPLLFLSFLFCVYIYTLFT